MDPSAGDACERLLEVEMEDRGEVRIIRMRGELDMSTVGLVRDAAADHDGPFVLDIPELAFIDSTGLRVLMEMRSEATVLIHAPSAAVRRVLELTRLEERLAEIDSLDSDALDRLS